MHNRRIVFAAATLLMIALYATAQQKPTPPSGNKTMGSHTDTEVWTPDKLKWGPAPAVLPGGAELAVLEGNPMAAVPYTMRLKMPSGYKLAPHWHPGIEHVTLISGSFKVGMGEKWDDSKMTALPVGTFAHIAPHMPHFAAAEGETVIQLHGSGPWKLVYVDAKDDPSKKQK